MTPSRTALLAGLALAGFSAWPEGALAQGANCTTEAARIRRAESELPRLAVAPPDDRQIVCITLETNVLFARKLAAHVAHCPRSPYARNAETWNRTASAYSAQFNSRGCKTAIRGYRG